MAFKRMIQAVETHAGIPMRVVPGGIRHIPGATGYDTMKWLEQNDVGPRKLLLREPRGYPAQDRSSGDVGRQLDFGCHRAISMREPATDPALETSAGLIRIRAHHKGNSNAKMAALHAKGRVSNLGTSPDPWWRKPRFMATEA